MIKKVDDTYRKFIERNMVQYSDKYNDDDFDIYFNLTHTNIFAFKDNVPIAFGCILHIEDKDLVCYTWNDDTYSGKKGYAKGIEYIKNNFKNLVFEENGKKIMGDRL